MIMVTGVQWTHATSGSYGAGIQLKVHYMQSDVQLKIILESHK